MKVGEGIALKMNLASPSSNASRVHQAVAESTNNFSVSNHFIPEFSEAVSTEKALEVHLEPLGIKTNLWSNCDVESTAHGCSPWLFNIQADSCKRNLHISFDNISSRIARGSPFPDRWLNSYEAEGAACIAQ
jgi:hypothetical protein